MQGLEITHPITVVGIAHKTTGACGSRFRGCTPKTSMEIHITTFEGTVIFMGPFWGFHVSFWRVSFQRLSKAGTRYSGVQSSSLRLQGVSSSVWCWHKSYPCTQHPKPRRYAIFCSWSGEGSVIYLHPKPGLGFDTAAPTTLTAQTRSFLLAVFQGESSSCSRIMSPYGTHMELSVAAASTRCPHSAGSH